MVGRVRVLKTTGFCERMSSPQARASKKRIKAAITKFGLTLLHVNARLDDRVSRDDKSTEDKELAIRPQKGKEAESVKRDHSRARYVSRM